MWNRHQESHRFLGHPLSDVCSMQPWHERTHVRSYQWMERSCVRAVLIFDKPSTNESHYAFILGRFISRDQTQHCIHAFSMHVRDVVDGNHDTRLYITKNSLVMCRCHDISAQCYYKQAEQVKPFEHCRQHLHAMYTKRCVYFVYHRKSMHKGSCLEFLCTEL